MDWVRFVASERGRYMRMSQWFDLGEPRDCKFSGGADGGRAGVNLIGVGKYSGAGKDAREAAWRFSGALGHSQAL